MAELHCTINGQTVTCEQGATILEAAKCAGIHIPSLCHMSELDHHPAACRICVVKVAGMPRLAASCVTKVTEGMAVETESGEIAVSRKRTLDLLCKRHRMDCEYCPDYTFCELHALVRELGLDDRRYSQVYHQRNADETSPCVTRDNSKCVRCRRCAAACEKQGVKAIGPLFRAAGTEVGAVVPLSETDCVGCGQCVKSCPTGALFVKDDTDLLWRALNNKKKLILGITPQTANGLARFFGAPEERNELGKIAAIARKIGAYAVYDLTGVALLGASDTAEKLRDKSAVLTASCPAAKKFFRDNGSFVPLASPEALFDRVAREIHGEDAFTVFVSSCTAAKREHDCDAVLTTTELFQWFQRASVSRFTANQVWERAEPVEAPLLPGIPAEEKAKSLQDKVSELTGQPVETVFGFRDNASANGIRFMFACPGGCDNGGGQFRTHGYQKE